MFCKQTLKYNFTYVWVIPRYVKQQDELHSQVTGSEKTGVSDVKPEVNVTCFYHIESFVKPKHDLIPNWPNREHFT